MLMTSLEQVCACRTTTFFCRVLSLFSLNRPLGVTLDEYRSASMVMLYVMAMVKVIKNVITDAFKGKSIPVLLCLIGQRPRDEKIQKRSSH